MTSWRNRRLPRSFVRGGRGPVLTEIGDGSAGEQTWWNGEPAVARKVQLQVGMPPAGLHPQYWAAGLVGMIVDAVRVEYGGTVFYLEDEDGDGWRKVTVGRGGPRWPSASLYGTEVG